MMRALATLLVAALALASPATRAERIPFPPVDNAAAQPGFLAFRTQLQAAVARRDAAAVMAVLAPDIQVTFDGENGVSGFRAAWTPEAPDSPLWDALATILALGGDFDAFGGFEAPYVTSEWPEELDGFDHVAIVGSGVRVRAAARADAEVIATLGHEIVAVGGEDVPGGAWLQVVLDDGRTGFVEVRDTRSPSAQRARFEKVDGAWRMVALISGD